MKKSFLGNYNKRQTEPFTRTMDILILLFSKFQREVYIHYMKVEQLKNEMSVKQVFPYFPRYIVRMRV
jgi:hypothetical protein